MPEPTPLVRVTNQLSFFEVMLATAIGVFAAGFGLMLLYTYLFILQ